MYLGINVVIHPTPQPLEKFYALNCSIQVLINVKFIQDWEEPCDVWKTDSVASGSFSTSSGDPTTSYEFTDSGSEMSAQNSYGSTMNPEQEASSSQILFTDGSLQSESVKQVEPQAFLYIVMQLCKRETLKDWLEVNKNLDPITRGSKAREIFQQICSGVGYIHQQKLIHRY